MAFTSGFFNSVNHDRKYDAVQMGQIFDGIIKDGIYATYLSAMVVKESANASEVIVQPGRAWFNHVWAYNDADYPMAAPDPEVVLDRIDTLVLDVNSEDAVREAKYMWVQGTPTSQIPEPPTLIHTATHNQYPLADVYRQAGTTQIYATDITNRVGTSDCPFVTGIIETINIDSLLRQWDAEFHTWESATKNAFEGWMLNQEDAYTLWWNSMKSQMEDDVEELEAWIETIHDILDEEVATRLQAEIDEIKTQLPSGSHITVTTTDSELFNRTVTITDEDNNTVTSTFNESGVAVFKTVPYVGTLTIESTDGIRTATNAVSTPYFARYAFNLAFWSATVNISADAELGGETCVVSNSESITVTSIVLNAEGEGVFNATYPDTYKFSVTHGGETMEVSLAVTQETTYNVEIHSGLNYQAWLNAGGVSESFSSLDEVLADEETLRQLFLVHDAVDYVASQRVNNDLTKIFNTDLAAKWINNSDYALDTFYAVADIKTVMDTADKYGYGEWCLMPQVPKMTSNSAPYGEASASGANSGYEAYKAFDGNTSTYWVYASSSGYIQYHFIKKIAVKKMVVKLGSGARFASYTLKGSNDGTNFTDLVSGTNSQTGVLTIEKDVPNDTEYEYLRLDVTSNESAVGEIQELQFYAYAPKGCVPVMTSNTAPYGECIGVSASSSSDALYDSFDNNDSTYTATSSPNNGGRIGYRFTTPVSVRKFMFYADYGSYSGTVTVALQYSDDGTTWVDAETAQGYTLGNKQYFNSAEHGYHLYWAVNIVKSTSSLRLANTVQFYGRQLSVSVPVMTGYTTPYGEASASGVYGGGGGDFYAWKAFDKNIANGSKGWINNSGNGWIQYEFDKPIILKEMSYFFDTSYDANRGIDRFEVKGSNDGTNFTVIDDFTTDRTALVWHSHSISNNTTPYKIIRAYCYNTTNANPVSVTEIDFYGVDYSEKEFEPGTTKKWLYDHGVELETIVNSTTGASSVAEKKADELYISVASTTQVNASMLSNQDLTDYNLLRAKFTDANSNGGILGVYSTTTPTGSTSSDASMSITAPLNDRNNAACDISSFNQTKAVGIRVSNGSSSAARYLAINELWLE